MKEYLPIIKARSGLFRGIEESELEKLFGSVSTKEIAADDGPDGEADCCEAVAS